ncbi:MAG: AAA family ATPase, partial [Verrucomicrobiales bacterium]|nr:AAA family ATPase [Verrucomicrobiales bacterium]
MFIRHLRLRNIKSYGEQPDGSGILVSFLPGINRIAGRNGEGKSTLIEALGYALFLADPVFEENFQVQTYFLRAGTKHGEIEVSFDHEGANYRVLRTLGHRHPLRDKIILGADDSLGAEGTAEVDAFLCRLFRIPEAGRLREWFGKLIGVKQGRLTWPFDAKPSDARRHFEPLLDVELFRQCFDRLKGVTEVFEASSHEQALQLEGVAQRVRDRADSPVRLGALRSSTDALQQSLDQDSRAVAAAQADVASLERAEATLRAAESAERTLAEQRRLAELEAANAVRALEEARTAARIADETRDASQAYRTAETALGRLLERQSRRHALEQEIRRETKALADLEVAAAGTREQLRLFGEQHLAKSGQHQQGQRQLLGWEAELAALAAPHGVRQARLQVGLDSLASFRTARASATATFRRHASLASRWAIESRELAQSDPAALTAARAAEAQASETLAALDRSLAAAGEAHDRLSRQLAEIQGGVCPFLKERCRQFDPAKVQEDLAASEAASTHLAAQRRDAAYRLAETRTQLDALTAREARAGHLVEAWRSLASEIGQEHDRVAQEPVSGWIQTLHDATTPPPEGTFPALPTLPTASTFPPLAIDAGPPSRGRLLFDLPALVEAQTRFLADWTALDLLLAQAVDQTARALQTEGERLEKLRYEIHHARRQLTSLAAEMVELQRRHEELTRKLADVARRSDPIRAQLKVWHEELTTFETLPSEIRAQQDELARHTEAHSRHLGVRTVADELPGRTATATTAARRLEELARDLAARSAAAAAARAMFDPNRLIQARSQLTEATARQRAAEERLHAARRDLAGEEIRFAEFQAARQHESVLQSGLARLAAAREINERARRLLRDAAPVVAQHLCDRIA